VADHNAKTCAQMVLAICCHLQAISFREKLTSVSGTRFGKCSFCNSRWFHKR